MYVVDTTLGLLLTVELLLLTPNKCEILLTARLPLLYLEKLWEENEAKKGIDFPWVINLAVPFTCFLFSVHGTSLIAFWHLICPYNITLDDTVISFVLPLKLV